MARNRELEQAIAADPEDAEPYLVYADWLQANGDPRGELIVLQHAGHTAKATALIERHALLGAAPRPKIFELDWARGFVRSARLGWQAFAGYDPAPRQPGDETEADRAHAALKAFLQLPSACFLQELRLGPVPGYDTMSLSGCAAVIEELAPACLRTLELGEIDRWDISSTETTMPASAAIRGLHTLVLRGGSVLIPAIELPELRSFRVESGSLRIPALHSIATARWPKLERLEIWCGDPSVGANGEVTDLAPIFAATGLPALRHLGIRNCPFADDVARSLVTSTILPQLATLDLSMGNLSDRGVDAMVAARHAFAHLERLELADNALTDVSRARDLAKHVEVGVEHDPERAVPRTERTRFARYVSVGE